MATQEIVRLKKRIALIDALPALLDQLRNQGFKLGAAEYQEAHELLFRLAQHGKIPRDPAGLRTYLAPLLCASPAEHSDFRDIFAAWAVPFTLEKVVREKPAADDETAEKVIRRFRFRVRLWTPVFLVTAVLLTGIAFWWIGVNPSNFRWPTMSDWPRPEGWLSILRRTALSALGLIAGLVALALIVRKIWLYLTIRRYLRRRATSAPFDVQPFFVEARPGRLFQTIAIKRASQTFRRHLRMPAEDLDIPATVEATARGCGRFFPVKGYRYHAPEYLMLVDRAAFRDHLAEWVDALIDRLAENDVAIRRYYFNRDPRSCMPESGLTGPMNLMELACRYAEHRLIIFADADILTNPYTGKPPEWIEQFFAWEQRGLMTLSPLLEMGNSGRSPSLAHDFIVMPLDETGLTDLIDRMNGDPIGIDDGIRPGGQFIPTIIAEIEPTAPRPPNEAEEESLIASLKGAMDPEGWHWLCACAVYPDLRWGLTLHLGQNLKDRNGRPLLSRDRLLRMIRLPWFRHGLMPDWLRERLIDDDALRGAREREVRRELFSLMRTAGETGALLMEYAQINERLIPRIVRAMRRLVTKNQGAASPLRDGIFLDFMANPLSVYVPRELNRFVKRYWKKGRTSTEKATRPRYELRKTPMTVSEDEFKKVFRLNENRRPLEYVQNDYHDNGDGTVTDRATGLTWQKSGSPKYIPFKETQKYIGQINRDRFAGYSDWRLPTVDELASLLEPEKKGKLYIDPIFDDKQLWCWSADERASGGAWYANFNNGYVHRYTLNLGYCVRAVRP